MSKPNSSVGLSEQQRRFLRDLDSDSRRLPSRMVMKDNEVSIDLLAEWLAQPEFAAAMRRWRRVLNLLRELDLLRGAAFAARRLTRAAFGSAGEHFRNPQSGQRRVCLDLQRLVRVQNNARERRTTAAHQQTAPRLSDAITPDEADELVARIRAELIARMPRDPNADAGAP